MMCGIAASIVVGEAYVLWAIPEMGVIYLPLVGLLAAALILIPSDEYRTLRQTASVPNSPSPELLASNLLRLRPQLRMYAPFLLGLALLVAISFFFMPGPWADRALPAVIMFSAIVFFGAQFRLEQRIVSNYTSTMARIVRFEQHRKNRAAIYEYDSPVGVCLKGKGGPLRGFSIGMRVPILYNVSQPRESRPVPDFMFYRIRAEQP